MTGVVFALLVKRIEIEKLLESAPPVIEVVAVGKKRGAKKAAKDE